MNCSNFRLNVSPYLDTALSFAEQKLFKNHLEACNDCAAILAQMVAAKFALKEGITGSLSPDFVSQLQERLRSEIDNIPSWWQQLNVPQRYGFSPVSLGGMVAAAIAVVVLSVSLFQQETAPLINVPTGLISIERPVTINPANLNRNSAPAQLLTTVPGDSAANTRDSSQRDFSPQIKLVNQNR